MTDGAAIEAVDTVYVLHFDQPLAGRRQHYTGWTRNLRHRLFDHWHNGSASAQIVRQARKAGIGWTVALTVDPASQAGERRVKGIVYQLRPLCGGDAAEAAAHGMTGVVSAVPDVKPSTRAERRGGGRTR